MRNTVQKSSNRGEQALHRRGRELPPPQTPPEEGGRDVFDLMEGELVDDYADRIRAAREEKEWSTLDLAQAIKEREILVKKIEKGDLIPRRRRPEET